VTVCAAGGSESRSPGLGAETCSAKDGNEIEIKEQTLERQCDHEYIDQIRPFVGDYEAILSMACGQDTVCGRENRTKPVMPMVNTTFFR